MASTRPAPRCCEHASRACRPTCASPASGQSAPGEGRAQHRNAQAAHEPPQVQGRVRRYGGRARGDLGRPAGVAHGALRRVRPDVAVLPGRRLPRGRPGSAIAARRRDDAPPRSRREMARQRETRSQEIARRRRSQRMPDWSGDATSSRERDPDALRHAYARRHSRRGPVGDSRADRLRPRRGRRSDRHRRGRRRHSPGTAARQEPERVHIGVLATRQPHAEVKVRTRDRSRAARADRSDRVARGERVALPHRDRLEMEVRGLVATVVREDRDRAPRASHRAAEEDRASPGRDDRRSRGRRDVDPAVLGGRVRIVPVAVGRRERPFDGPCPAARGLRRRRRAEQDD